MSPDLFWIVGPGLGRLAIATRPRGGDWLEDELAGSRRVSLLETNAADQLDLVDERQAAEANGVRFISFPIPDRGIPASMPQAISLMADLVSALAIAGASPADAIQVVSSARGLTIPETPDQRQWVQGLSLKPAQIAR